MARAKIQILNTRCHHLPKAGFTEKPSAALIYAEMPIPNETERIIHDKNIF